MGKSTLLLYVTYVRILNVVRDSQGKFQIWSEKSMESEGILFFLIFKIEWDPEVTRAINLKVGTHTVRHNCSIVSSEKNF